MPIKPSVVIIFGFVCASIAFIPSFIVMDAFWVPENYDANNYVKTPCERTGEYEVGTFTCGKSESGCYINMCEYTFALEGQGTNISNFFVPLTIVSTVATPEWEVANATGPSDCSPLNATCWYNPQNPSGTYDADGNLIPNVRITEPDPIPYFATWVSLFLFGIMCLLVSLVSFLCSLSSSCSPTFTKSTTVAFI